MEFLMCFVFSLLLIINGAFTLKLDNENKIINRTNILTSEKSYEDYQVLKEFKGFCQFTSDCRLWAYVCRAQLCECAVGYKPDATNETCVGAIGRRCMYDSHCITNAYCRKQTVCTCKAEFPLESEDKWFCDDDSMASKLRETSLNKIYLLAMFANSVRYF